VKPGDVIAGRFVLESRIGTGGMGVVFRALDRETQHPVAIKVLDGRSAIDVERAHREAQILARLADPAIVGHVADGLTDGGQVFLAMDWIRGITAGERIAQTGFSLREAIVLARRVAGALASAHGAGILHRDIKPSNVLLPDGDPAAAMLIDFGIARITDTISSLTRTGHAIGTPGYMAPEQARGERALGPATDVFGLGCLLYECATGQPAFSGSAPVAVIVKILMSEPVAIADLCPEIDADVRTLVERMLVKDPAQRVPDGAALVRELAALGSVGDGPRRSAQHLASATRNLTASGEPVHCLVMAARGQPDDLHDPPSDRELGELREVASAHAVALEVLATGSVVGHLAGPPRSTTVRAAAFAIEVRRILPQWSIALTSGGVADSGSSLLASGVMADLFGQAPAGSIVVDREAASHLGDDYEVQIGRRDARLLRRRAV